MSDPLDFPPSRPLPEGVRDRARLHLAEGMAAPRRTSHRTPLVIAAAVVLLAAAGAVVTQGLGGGGGSTAAGPSTVPNTPQTRELPPPDLVDDFHARDGWAPPEVVDRCAAEARGLPGKEAWTPLMTTVVHETTLSAFRTGPDGVFFCETTPTSVTVSRSWAPDTGGAPARIRFISTQGSVAGFVQPQVGLLRLLAADGRMENAHALIAGDVFLTPQGFRGVETGVTFVVDSERELPATDLPAPSPATVDRPQPPGDRVTDEGRRLGACLDAGPAPAPDRANWVPGAHAVLSATSEVQLGRYHDLLVVCAVRELDQPPSLGVVDLSDITGPHSGGQELVGRSIWGTGRFYDFQSTPDGAQSSDSRGYVGIVLDDRAASITLTRQGFPDATAVIAGGTFVLAGPATKGMATVPPGVEVTVRDAGGAVLEQFSPGG
ncbi:hypothetical protein [Umezawaea sp. Da 62-37]|uniref:hypothetical protein n=1 Tax=Umezawaea sp. Da 62-37 TaxID=3075927 RepID=UPI0028F72A6B|nr:hypothetical protein [Umezawaea sp. Da 62-37]WNV85666.1 hypothetical protein RM788_47375 [Umezawaea sp. Da 62-37]